MKTKKDSPGVYLPPPMFYVAIFFLSLGIQHYLPLPQTFFAGQLSHLLAPVCIGLGLIAIFPALLSFLRTRNTLITILPATSLQTKGIYHLSRNPMYVGLLLLYTGIALIKGNIWTLILIPLVILAVTRFVIRKEEHYLERAFGQEYLTYKTQVRRWL